MVSTFQIVVECFCFGALATIAAVCAYVGLTKVVERLRVRLCPASLLLFAVAAGIATSEAQKRGGDDAAGVPLPREVVQGGDAVLWALPNAMTNAAWLAHGAFEDAFYVPATNWWARMQDGGWIDRLRIFSSGGFQAKGTGDGTWISYPPPFAQKLSLAPAAHWPMLADVTGGAPVTPESGQEAHSPSLFWHGATPSNTLVMTWWGGLYGRAHTNLVNFQAELFNDGSFDYRYADHTEHFGASLPFDLDGDGLENSVDPDPLTAGPDAHGTNAEWHNAVCSNILSAVATSCVPPGGGAHSYAPVELTWLEDVNSNAYYFVDVVSERGPAPIYFTGDRNSRLGNPVVVALAGITNRVPLLIGIDYAVTSDAPFSVSFPVDYIYPMVTTNGVANYKVHWPLNFVFTEGIGASNRVYAVTVEPYDPGGVLEWGVNVPMRGGSDGECGCVYCEGNSATFTCSSTCTCSGGCRARGRYLCELAEFALEGGECRCGFDDPSEDVFPDPPGPNDGPSLTITFSKSVVIFEDAYEDRPGVTEPRRSTRVRLTIDAYGGPNGGSLLLSGQNLANLVKIDGGVLLPYAWQLAAGESYHVTGIFEGVVASEAANDVRVFGSFFETGTGTSLEDNVTLSVVQVKLMPIVEAPKNKCAYRHSYGVCELVQHIQEPSSPVVTWNPAGGGSNEVYAGALHYRCPLDGSTNPLRVEIGTEHYTPKVEIIEPDGMESKAVRPIVYSNAVHKGEAGGIGMELHLYVTPLDVSFSEIAVEEVPCFTYEVEGYFENPYFNGVFAHTGGWWGAGAGRWFDVDRKNKFADYDTAAYIGKIPWLTPEGAVTTNPAFAWTAGYAYMDNPFGWNVKGTAGDASPYKRFGETIKDTYMLNGQGKVGVFKLNNWVERTTNDVVHLYGPKDEQ